MAALQRLLKYITIDTQSDPESNSCPTTAKQLELAQLLVSELKALGVEEVKLSPEGVVYAFIKSNSQKQLPNIGFIAHMDTSPDCSGANVQARIIKDYKGEVIVLNAEKQIVSDPKVIHSLLHHIGKTLLVTNGTTLLGADNKAGIAIIMQLATILQTNKNFEHGNVHIAFTPDEEVGKGSDHFDVKYFNCAFAYTVDGGCADEIEFENFNAASCKVEIEGLNTHPGSAKGIMINSQHIAMEFHQLLPQKLDPALTEGYEGFNHLSSMRGEVEKTTLSYIIRNHNRKQFEEQKHMFEKIKNALNYRYKKDLIKVTLRDSYYNMHDLLINSPHVLNIAQKAIRQAGLEPTSNPIRGGTDGARLTFMGLPCPNLGTGGYNFHGRNEYLVVEELEQMVDILKNIVTIVAEEKMNS